MSDTWVIEKEVEDSLLYLTGYNAGSPGDSTFGNVENAIEFDSEEEAEPISLSIGGVRPVKKPHH